MLCEELKKPAEYLKNKKKGENEMFELYNFLTDESQEKIKKQLENSKNEGIVEGEKLGMAKSLLNSIKSLMTNLHLTAENAVNALNIPKEEQSFYLAQLNTL